MWGTEPELLVVLDDPAGEPCGDGTRPDAGRDALAGVGRVTSAMPPRLVLLAGVPAERAGEVAALPGVRGAFAGDVPAALREALSPAESLFVDGWLARRHGKDRGPGEGLPWDAPGFSPPDPPPA
ncbi:conserved hypothetical protein [Frankia canadensis]|uniref:Uncharacterized protein n=1 Tax=Frankia canadensis TaxID=1836972 RepID=A0A2I2KLH2_9ACTN|nr:conserved hypothetical protein [Frankia canadensis]SOU53810.1 conserved hypothetical protein [Frankia canadensis]